jgi:ornithine cyclodeaminase/alanine dehydrogenase-like protein (mu-crystallin family)
MSAMDLERQPQVTSDDGCFVLSYSDVARLIRKVPLDDFLDDLVEEIEVIHADKNLVAIMRSGWLRDPDTLEVMGCQSTDYSCVKVISSNPSLSMPVAPVVTGSMICTAVGSDQARLVCDATVLTPLRTAAGTAVVMKAVGMRGDSLGVIGAGLEGVAHAIVLTTLFENMEKIVLIDRDAAQARCAATQVRKAMKSQGRDVDVVSGGLDTTAAALSCHAIVTATYGDTPVVSHDATVADGTFIAAVGADLDGKRELDHHLYDRGKFVADDLAQCLRDGELRQAARRLRVARASDIKDHAGELLDGRIVSVSRLLEKSSSFVERGEALTIYDSTGFSGQDLAMARVLLRLAQTAGLPRKKWNPPDTKSLVDLLATSKDGEVHARRLRDGTVA